MEGLQSRSHYLGASPGELTEDLCLVCGDAFGASVAEVRFEVSIESLFVTV
jgi:hypothetical protein